MKSLFICLTIMMLGSVASSAEESHGAINGKVLDADGKPVWGATITMVVDGKENQRTSGKTGVFRYGELKPGTYKLRVDMKGYKLAIKSEIRVQSGKATYAEIRLQKKKE